MSITIDYKSIANTIIGLKKADLQFRDHLIQSKQLEDAYNPKMENLHNSNAKILEDIIDTIGYPTIAKVGGEANDAAWLVIQHAIGKPQFMKKCLSILENGAIESCPKKIAHLSDRIAVFEGRLQIYGTQFDWDHNNEMSPQPIKDMTNVNVRRKSIGMNTLEEQTTVLRLQVKNDKQRPPPDLNKRNREYDKWRRAVGWI